MEVNGINCQEKIALTVSHEWITTHGNSVVNSGVAGVWLKWNLFHSGTAPAAPRKHASILREEVSLSQLIWIRLHIYSERGSVESYYPWPSAPSDCVCHVASLLISENKLNNTPVLSFWREDLMSHALCTQSFHHCSALGCYTVHWWRDEQKRCWQRGTICPH